MTPLTPLFNKLNALQGNPDVAGSVTMMLVGVILALALVGSIAAVLGPLSYHLAFNRADREADVQDIYRAMMLVGVPYEVRLALLQKESGLGRERVKEIALGKRLAHALVPGVALVLTLGSGACVTPAPRYEALPLQHYHHEAELQHQQPAPTAQPDPDWLPDPWAGPAGPAGPAGSAGPAEPAEPARATKGWADHDLHLHAWRPEPGLPYWLTLEWASQMASQPECKCSRRASRGRVLVRCVCSAVTPRIAKHNPRLQ